VDVKEIVKALSAPFDPKDVKFKPQTIQGDRALAVAYVTARGVMDRLDTVLGPENWQDDYEPLPDGNVLCRLKVRLGDEWVIKCDVGGQSEQKDGGDRNKSAVSDALKRAAVKFGVGRYLYNLPLQWCPWDAQKRKWVQTPRLPGATQAAARTQAAPAQQAAPSQPVERMGPFATSEQVDRILTLATERKVAPVAFVERLKKRFGVDAVGKLTASEADVIIKLLENPPQKAA
jgi:hypothetical protein